MTQDQIHFLLELLMTREERILLAELKENPKDEATRNAYVDFLIDAGRTESAEIMRRPLFVPTKDMTSWLDELPGASTPPTPFVRDYDNPTVTLSSRTYQIASGSIVSGALLRPQINASPTETPR